MWFRDDEAREYLIDFIKRQTKLTTLFLNGNNLKGSETEKDLAAWKKEHAKCSVEIDYDEFDF